MYSIDEAAVAGVLFVPLVISLIVSVFMLVCMWKVYEKAGKPGWGVIVPFYNNYLLFEIAMGNGWLFLLTLVPFVNFVVLIMLYIKLASAFGKEIGFGFGLFFLGIIFFPILAFGDAEYIGAQ